MAEDPDPTPYLFISLEQKRKDQTKPYDGKKMVWVPDEKEGFLIGNISSTKGDIVTVDVGKGEEVCVSKGKEEEDVKSIFHRKFSTNFHNPLNLQQVFTRNVPMINYFPSIFILLSSPTATNQKRSAPTGESTKIREM